MIAISVSPTVSFVVCKSILSQIWAALSATDPLTSCSLQVGVYWILQHYHLSQWLLLGCYTSQTLALGSLFLDRETFTCDLLVLWIICACASVKVIMLNNFTSQKMYFLSWIRNQKLSLWFPKPDILIIVLEVAWQHKEGKRYWRFSTEAKSKASYSPNPSNFFCSMFSWGLIVLYQTSSDPIIRKMSCCGAEIIVIISFPPPFLKLVTAVWIQEKSSYITVKM